MPEAISIGLKASEWIMIFAVVAGPIFAVWVTRFHDIKSDAKSRKQSILRSLLRTRQIRLDPEHVGALNLIEIEFYNKPSVVDRYTEYIGHLNKPLPPENAHEVFFQERHDLFVGLLHAIGRDLGYAFDKHDLDKRSYAPVAWGNEQERQRKNAALITELLEGSRSLPVFNMVADKNLFPPPPKI
jgi:hypothetical protein